VLGAGATGTDTFGVVPNPPVTLTPTAEVTVILGPSAAPDELAPEDDSDEDAGDELDCDAALEPQAVSAKAARSRPAATRREP
jgi:hypothetical protein